MSTFSEQLRFFRKAKGFSQLSLALEAGMSSKHVSFIENERSKPSKDSVLRLSEALDLPLRTRNELLSLAGFAEHYSRTPLDKSSMQRLSQTLEIILAKHEPYPAIILDWDWNIMMQTNGFGRLFELCKAQRPAFPDTRNIAEMIFDPQAIKPFIGNWQEVANTTVLRLRHEQQLAPGRHEALLKQLATYPDFPKDPHHLSPEATTEPFIYVDFVLGGNTLKFLTTLTSFGTPTDITAAEILIEQYYPADDFTRAFLDAQS